MRTLVTGSSGHLGEAIVRTLRARGEDVVGMDVRPSPWTDTVGSVADPDAVRAAMTGADVVLHTATLHKPQLAFVPGQAFIDTNVSGTLSLLLAAADVGRGRS
ncbi:dTDP-glucose 4,6-dehydratase [Mycolicibacterium fortuitum]|uniref:dTDP-glucose 4,6-dehydratase n=1 Tax=Mycolicibacterium fortuitum TaxID=1766 RepID=A0A378U909_MYCFO|nr:dTDP-glucose 4,6-dehydratase [Mycolicibacterium fortuitum]